MSIPNAIFKTLVGVGVGTVPALSGQAPPPVLLHVVSPETLTLLAMVSGAVGGAYASFSWGEPVEPRSKLFRLFVSCVIMGLAFTALVNSGIASFTSIQLTLGVKVGLSAVVSCLTRFTMPKIIDSIKDGTWRDVIPFIRKKG